MGDILLNKTYFFLSGMHRSGNTVLASILNQNPDFYVGPNSPLIEYMWQIHKCKDEFETTIMNPNMDRTDNVIRNLFSNYYYNVDQPIIFDKSKAWANLTNILMIKEYLTNTPKIIFTIRPLAECIASFIKVNFERLFSDMISSGYRYNPSLSENDNLAEFILNADTGIVKLMNYAFYSYTEKETRDYIHLVKYQDLLDSPSSTMNSIYNFLGLPAYEHNFNNIGQAEKEKDSSGNFPEELHSIKTSLSSSGLKPSDYLSDKIINKCNEIDVFFNG